MTDNNDNIPQCSFPPGSERVEYKDLDPAQKELSDILSNIKHDPTLMGVVHLGQDGIFRSLTADRDVVDAVPFSPLLIKAMMDRLPYREQTDKDFRGINGTKTPKEQWYKPLPGILPPPLEEEHRERSEEKLEENRRLYHEREKRVQGGEKRAVCLMSDNDLGLGLEKRKPKTTSESG
ncbi:hypothetical protein F53441_9909 [Fusarium austroafricanum]|uniref:Uncharacterized protein n=1 Tax=Fusarium austroafricanum TaxID=2364996 RepID=A0A8H4K843_9HYPO|nr:hypothetical protein F53441_9909 [Fusarium austroafricanum]